ncbi:glycoside hydrolase family 65 protein [Bradyrhizobium sp. OAE829]|uniref:glycoside hydrolase family 65 protein n=1 Tax=Bradyrhizobium sp. OAE829 TaxID=2663807 RepID=UPI0019E3E428
MDGPISPPPVTGSAANELPAYLSNGVVGLKIRDNPLNPGMALLSGFSGEHPERKIEAAAFAPYPLAGDICLEGVWMSDTPQSVHIVDQAYDFSTAELTTRLRFRVKGHQAKIAVTSFCSREQPTVVCQEIAIDVDAASDLKVRARIDLSGIEGRPLRYNRDTPGEAKPSCDGSVLWESAGAISTCGIAYVTELVGDDAKPQRPPLDGEGLRSEYAWRGRRGRRYKLRQLVSLVPSALHNQPDYQASRLIAMAANIGFDLIKKNNRACWAQLWRSRIRLVGAEKRWQAMADAAFFYLMSSGHSSSPASTSMFGLATWHDYHYYFGHVMWDIETFCVPPLLFLQPDAAKGLLDYRARNLEAARSNARLMGRRGLQFPWESAPSSGEEAAPMPGSAAWREDHASLDIARAFALCADVIGDDAFLRDKAWPVLFGVAEWIKSRVTKRRGKYEIRASMGIAERKSPSDNAVFTNLSAQTILRDAISAAKRLNRPVDPAWLEMATKMVVPKRGKVIISHDAFRVDEEKAATPDPLMGIFPLSCGLDDETEQATLAFYLKIAKRYIGSPMLSALYGVWAARSGNRRLSLEMLDRGYGDFCTGRFMQTLEYRKDVFPEQPPAGPFFANLGGLLLGLILGFPRIEPGPEDPQDWCKGPVLLPTGWRSIEIDRIWIRGKPWRMSAVQGAPRAQLAPCAGA